MCLVLFYQYNYNYNNLIHLAQSVRGASRLVLKSKKGQRHLSLEPVSRGSMLGGPLGLLYIARGSPS